jgi:uncharacterized phage protein (TIGR02218 family)
MKTLPAGLAASLAAGVTTLCSCWRVEREDGQIFGYTDHDRDLSFDGVTYKADSGYTGSAFVQRLGLAVDTQDVSGALSSDEIDEDDLARGLWDDAAFELYRVDWSTVANRVLVAAGSLGEVERGPIAFRAELRSLAHYLNQPTGRTLSSLCDADLGDERCTVDLDQPSYSQSATVSAVIKPRSAFRTSGLGSFAKDWCKRGHIIWTSGSNDGAKMEIKRHTLDGTDAVIELMADMPFDIEAGDVFTALAGCDKTAATCETKFSNILNHRGFPFMPGNDWVTGYPNRGDGNDGGQMGGGS